MKTAPRQLLALLFVAFGCTRPAPDAGSSTPTSTATSTSISTSTSNPGEGRGLPSPSTSTSTSTSTPTPTSTSTSSATSTSPLITARPYSSLAPRSYSSSTPAPLILALHGYGQTGRSNADYFGLLELAEIKGFLVAFPDGTLDNNQSRYWNATDGCCDFQHRGPDDVAYLTAVIDDMQARYRVDPKRIYVTGLSNGGFMSHRLACDLSPRIAAIVSLAGAQWNDPAKCSPTSPVAIVEVHEDADPTIKPAGGHVFDNTVLAPYPPLAKTVATWAAKNRCTGALTPVKGALDLNAAVGGDETKIERYEGCPPGGGVELWTMTGGAHVPALSRAWRDVVYAYFMAHPKP